MKKLLMLCSLIALSACSVVGPGERGVSVSLGKVGSEVRQPGAYLWIPFLYGNKSINIQVQKSDVRTSAASRDMQEITTELAINWSIDPDQVIATYKNIGDEKDVYARIIQPAVSEVMKASTSKRTAEEILSQRLDLKKDIDEGLKARLLVYGVKLTDVSIVDLQFSEHFARAVEEKQVAEQQAQQAKYNTQKAEQDAKSAIARAKGEAESQRVLKEQITPQLLQLKAIEKWSGQVPTVMGSGSNMLFNIPVSGKE